MTDNDAKDMAERAINSRPEIKDWRPAFIGATTAHRIFCQMVEEKERENYRLRMLLWWLHDCDEKEQWNGAQHGGIYMKCIVRGVDFAKDPIEKIFAAFQQTYPWKITQTAAGENSTHKTEG